MQPSPPSPNASKLHELEEELKTLDIIPERLAVLFMGANEMFFGEVTNQHTPYAGHEMQNIVRLKNPKRLSRIPMVDRATGMVNVEIRFGDFDFISGGEIAVQYQGGFYLEWLDEDSRGRYYKAYVDFEKGRKLAAAQQAGLVAAVPAMPSGLTSPLIRGR